MRLIMPQKHAVIKRVMQSNLYKIIVAFIVVLFVIGVGIAVWVLISIPHTAAPSNPSQTTQGGGLNGQNTVTVSGTQGQESAQTQAASTSPDINAAYATLFPQILGTEAVFVQATATSTGDLGNIYKLYAADVAADQKAYPKDAPFSVDVALTDLTNDGKPEAIVYENLLDFCGSGGCTLDIYQKTGNNWHKIFSTVGAGVVGLSNTLTGGYLDLYLTVGGNTVDRYIWDGSTYKFKETMAMWNGSSFVLTQ